MLKKLLPVVSLILGLGTGGAAAIVLAPKPKDAGSEADSVTKDAGGVEHAETDEEAGPDSTEIVKLPNQFVVPVIMNNRVRAMVILTVAIEVETGLGDQVRALEPKLRDTFLSELFALAALDGFKDDLISRQTLDLVKRALSEKAKAVLGQDSVSVLITDMARQDTF